tara:strand:+ start:4034 stop:4390 length:357 start_codon:yes stop_codon:yes gene_type:complete
MNSIKNLLLNNDDSEIKSHLINFYKNNIVLSNSDIYELKAFETTDYALIGIIGLLINSKARILLGKKQVYHSGIQNWCKAIETTDEDLMLIADKYLDDDFEDEPEFILRKVMLEYPSN